MNTIANVVLNSSNGALIIFTTAAAIASAFTRSPAVRAACGTVAVIASLAVFVSTRSTFAWTVSAVERPSFPGFVLLLVLAAAVVSGRRVATSAEFRFAAVVLALGGLALYPAATGFLNPDTYVIGYNGYVLPALLAAVIAFALYRGFFLTAFALNVAIAAFLLHAGTSRNLWDYVIDPVAWFIGCGATIAFAARLLTNRRRGEDAPVSAQPSAGIGETPISH
jgi:hypothetical protein